MNDKNVRFNLQTAILLVSIVNLIMVVFNFFHHF